MEEYLSLGKIKREKIAEKINKALFKRKEVVFACIFGSFVSSPSFRDIDIGIYVSDIEEKEVFDYELKLSKLIADKCDLPFDIIETHILNSTPSNFLNNIFCRGSLLFSKNQELLSDLIENTSLDAIANEYISKQSMEELIS
jgi:hypothetical protein